MTPDYYISQSTMSNPGKYSYLYADIPNDIEVITKISHGLFIHPSAAEKIYTCVIPENNISHINEHFMENILDIIHQQNNAPLSDERKPENRFVGLCRNFALFCVSVLRYHHIPARVRCGFAAYWHPGFNDDHWITEFWNRRKHRWVMIDSEIGNEERLFYSLQHMDNLNLTDKNFIPAGKAWQLCREGKADPDTFGTTIPGINGWWFIRANIVRDLNALNKVELQPWDYTEFADKKFNNLSELDNVEISLFDQLADMTTDTSSEALRRCIQICMRDTRLKAGNTITSYPGKKPVTVSLSENILPISPRL